jgi:RimJ/RimL family protein N-acetyltransferase
MTTLDKAAIGSPYLSFDTLLAVDINETYRILPWEHLDRGDLQFSGLRIASAERIRLWRNSQKDLLRQNDDITPEQQDKYFLDVIFPEFASATPNHLLLDISDDHGPVGYGGLVNLDWGNLRAEISFLLAPEHEQNPIKKAAIFATFLSVVKALSFRDLGLNKVFTDTFAFRESHISILENANFRLEGRLLGHYVDSSGGAIDSLLHGFSKVDWYREVVSG